LFRKPNFIFIGSLLFIYYCILYILTLSRHKICDPKGGSYSLLIKNKIRPIIDRLVNALVCGTEESGV